MYVINDFQLIPAGSDLYINNSNKGAKITNKKFVNILKILQKQKKLEITRADLAHLAQTNEVDFAQLETVLITQLNILKPMKIRKFPLIYINSDDPVITQLLHGTFEREFNVQDVNTNHESYENESLIIFYRQNYSHPDFKNIYKNLPEKTYLVTAGVIHNLLIMDNIYFKNSGLPSHFSNLHQLLAFLQSDITATKNNWLLFYREVLKNQTDSFPDPKINDCQKGYVAYCIHQFLSQFTNLWNAPTPMDQVNWLWHADLTSFSVHTEVAVHSPFSEYDMKLNLNCEKIEERA